MQDELPRLERGSFLALLDEAVDVARGIFPRIFLAVAIPPALAAGLMAALQMLTMKGIMVTPTAPSEFPNFFRGFSLVFGALIFYGLIRVLAAAAMVVGAARYLRGEPVTGAGAWRWALRWRTLGTLSLLGGVILLGWMCCVLPGIYFAIIFSLTVPVLAWEELSYYPAMVRSRGLVLYSPRRGPFSTGMGWVLLLGLAGVVLQWGVSFAIQLPVTLAQQVFMMRHIMGQTQAAQNPAQLLPSWFFVVQPLQTMVSVVGQQLVALFTAAGFTLLYLRLRGRKEGTDLTEALDRLGAPR